MKTFFLLGLLLVALTGRLRAADGVAAGPTRPNILFIMADDLNHWVGYLGRNKQTLTPNLDRLAASGEVFTHANCAAPVCNPSRTALFSGLRPGTTGVYGNAQDWRTAVPTDLTLITTLRRAGYEMLAAGKLYHLGFNRPEEFDDYFNEAAAAKGRARPPPVTKPQRFNQVVFAPLTGGDEGMPDWYVAGYGVEQLGRKHDKPFFLGIGFHKPHPPFMVPQKYFDQHPIETIELPPYQEDDLKDLPPTAVRKAIGQGTHEEIVKAGQWKQAIQAYLATITFVDAQIGRVLDALEQSPYRDNTIVVFMSDHGWQLGEKHHWGKTTLWEEVARAPMLWRVPGVTRPGEVCETPVDFMSVYPTLTDLCGVPTPKHVEGVTIRPLLADPAAKWDRPAITTSQFGQHSIRTPQWRYINYGEGQEELYDETKDPYEWHNLAKDPHYAAVKKMLAAWLPQKNTPPIGFAAGGDEEGEGGGRRRREREQARARAE